MYYSQIVFKEKLSYQFGTITKCNKYRTHLVVILKNDLIFLILKNFHY